MQFDFISSFLCLVLGASTYCWSFGTLSFKSSVGRFRVYCSFSCRKCQGHLSLSFFFFTKILIFTFLSQKGETNLDLTSGKPNSPTLSSLPTPKSSSTSNNKEPPLPSSDSSSPMVLSPIPSKCPYHSQIQVPPLASLSSSQELASLDLNDAPPTSPSSLLLSLHNPLTLYL